MLVECSVFGIFKAVAESDIVFFDLDPVAEPHYISQADPVDNLRRCKAVNLLFEDMVQAFSIIREEDLHPLAVVKAFYDFRNIHPALHVHVNEGFVRVIITARVFPFEPVNHIFDCRPGSEDLVRLLGRNVIKDIFLRKLVEIIRKLYFQPHKFLYGIVEYNRVEQVAVKVLRFTGFRIFIVAAIPEEAEVVRRDTRDI